MTPAWHAELVGSNCLGTFTEHWNHDTGVDTAGDDGVDDTAGDDGSLGPQCWPDHSPNEPGLFQCFGAGVGNLEWEQYVVGWSAAQLEQPVELSFPPQDENDPNAQACCETAAQPEEVNVGCIEDCARGACNLAIKRLQDKLSDGAPGGCVNKCAERFNETLTTWIDFLEANYDSCLSLAEGDAAALFLPDPPMASDVIPTGAGRSAVLTIDCTVDEMEPPEEIDDDCDTSLNEPVAAAWEDWSCPGLEGEVEIDGPQGYGWTAFEGSVTFRKGICASDPCWFSIESLELDATNFAQSGYIGSSMEASLAYQGFGQYDDSTNDGTIATMMFGLDVSMLGKTPTTGTAPYSFPMSNSDTMLLEVGAGGFQIVDAYFAWDDHEVTITTDLATCTCTSCI